MPMPEPDRGRSTISRAIRRRGAPEVRATGMRPLVWSDLYHRMMRLSWPRLILGSIAGFFAFNLLFAALYLFDPEGLAFPAGEAQVPTFWRNFFFSVHTVATIGYGNMYPVSSYANWLVVIEITLGIMFFALVTGLAFARFSRPTARIMFSENVVVHDVDGVPVLMLRAANRRQNLILAAQAQVSVILDSDLGGARMRRFVDLKLERASNPVFVLTWTIMHRIDEASPLRPWIEDPNALGDAELVVVLSGFDESSGQVIHARWAYGADEIRWNSRLADILGTDDSGVRTLDYSKFHEVEEL